MSIPVPAVPPGPPPNEFPAPWASDWGEDGRGLWQALTYKGARQGFRWIPPTPEPFLMGSPESEPGRDSDERQHPVLLTRGLWMAETACAQDLWEAVMGENRARFKGPRRPVENVSWTDAQSFIARLNRLLHAVRGESAAGEGPEPLRLRLPSEAEWEYACRAGTTGPYAFGDAITREVANFYQPPSDKGDSSERFSGHTVDVGSLPPNAWGLYEMHGNVWEWCADWYGYYPADLVADPVGPASGGARALRGGYWFAIAVHLRSASRDRGSPGRRNLDSGFRLALGPELQPASPGQPVGGGAGLPARSASGASGQRGRSGPAGPARSHAPRLPVRRLG